MARKKKHPEHVNHERWLVSYADFITLLFAFFTTLYAISTVDKTKEGKMQYSMRTAFNMELFTTPDDVAQYQGMSATATTMDGEAGIGSEGGESDTPAEGGGKEGGAKGKGGGSGGGDGKGGGEAKKLEQLAKEIKGSLGDSVLKDRVSMRMDSRGLVVSLSEAGFFASGSSSMDEEGRRALDVIVQKLSGEKYGLVVEGHTDDRPVRGGSYKSNWELSSARATSVISDAVERHKIDPSRLSVAAYGDTRPIADNSTDEGRAKNRRVDIVILKPLVPPPPEIPTDLEPEAGGDGGAAKPAEAKSGAEKPAEATPPAKGEAAAPPAKPEAPASPAPTPPPAAAPSEPSAPPTPTDDQLLK